jgi:hypothetical protein
LERKKSLFVFQFSLFPEGKIGKLIGKRGDKKWKVARGSVWRAKQRGFFTLLCFFHSLFHPLESTTFPPLSVEKKKESDSNLKRKKSIFIDPIPFFRRGLIFLLRKRKRFGEDRPSHHKLERILEYPDNGKSAFPPIEHPVEISDRQPIWKQHPDQIYPEQSGRLPQNQLSNGKTRLSPFQSLSRGISWLSAFLLFLLLFSFFLPDYS